MFTQKSQKSQLKFICEKCNYNTCKKCDFDKHCLTPKHKNHDKMFTTKKCYVGELVKFYFLCSVFGVNIF